MYFYYCNDAVRWLNKAKSRIFQCTVIFKKFQVHLYFVYHLPATCLPAVRPGSATCTSPIFSWRLQYKSVVLKTIHPLRHGDSFLSSLAFIVLLKGE